MKAHHAMNRRILVIDDSEIVLDVVKQTLEEAGYEVHTRNSPFLLLQVVRSIDPGLILLDVNMPALSGTKALEILAKYKLQVPVVFHSDRSEKELKEIVASTGAAGFIRKTSDANLFVTEVKHWIAAAG